MLEGFTAIFLRYILMPLMMIILAIVFSIAKKGKSVLKKKRLIIFVLLTGVLLAVPIVFLGLLKINFYPWGLICTHLYFIVFGFALVQFTYTEVFESIGFKDSLIPFIISIIVAMILGTWLYFILFELICDLDYGLFIAFGIIWVLAPIFFKWAEDFFIEIPPKIYKLWYPDPNPDHAHWETIDLRRLKEATIRIRRNPGDDIYADIDTKIPSGVNIGEWFNRFIEDHDIKFPNTPIILEEEQGEYYGWVFFKKRFIPFFNTPLDFEKQPDNLRLKDKSTIIAKRVVEVTDDDIERF